MPSQRQHVTPTTVVLVITLTFFISCSISNSFYRMASTRFGNNDWDILIFTQNWPVSVCLSWEEKHKGNTCTATESNAIWTIHGIWPTKLGNMGPFFCNLSQHFNPQGIYGIKDELLRTWAPIENHKGKSLLWRHEWEKHGTCAASLPSLQSEFMYFSKGIEWSKQYNMTEILTKSGITPGKMYNITSIWSAVKQELGKNPHVVCFTESVTKTLFLLEIRICFDKTLSLVDCDGTKVQSRWDYHQYTDANYTGCDFQKLVELPQAAPYPPSPLYNTPRELPFVVELFRIIRFISWGTS